MNRALTHYTLIARGTATITADDCIAVGRTVPAGSTSWGAGHKASASAACGTGRKESSIRTVAWRYPHVPSPRVVANSQALSAAATRGPIQPLEHTLAASVPVKTHNAAGNRGRGTRRRRTAA